MNARSIPLLSSLLAGLLAASPPAFAQEATSVAEAKAMSAAAAQRLKAARPEIEVRQDERTGLPRSVRGLAEKVTAPAAARSAPAAAPQPPEAQAREAAINFFASGVGRELFPKIAPTEGKRPVSVRADPDFAGSQVVELQQTYAGLDVLFARAKVTVNPTANVSSLSANFTPLGEVAIESTIDESQAKTVARTDLRRRLEALPGEARAALLAQEGAEPPESAKLVVFDPDLVGATTGDGAARLAWMVEIGNTRVIIDAANGDTLFLYRDKPSLLSQRLFDFADTITLPATPVLDDSAGGTPGTLQAEVEKIREHTRATYDFFATTFGRDGFDDNDGPGPAGSSPFISYARRAQLANAMWCPRRDQACPQAKAMVYGTGYGAALDIVGHEISHGIIQHEADLVYAGEAGALNEGLADVFGALVEQAQGSANWVIGEDWPNHSLASPLRDMRDPTSLGFDPTKAYGPDNRGQPDHYDDLVRYDILQLAGDPICGTTDDALNGCVHFNSGIVAKAATLLALGGIHRGTSVETISSGKLARIAYRVLTVELVPTSTLPDFATAAVKACDDLAALGDTTAADCASVGVAFQAVGLAATS